MSEVAGKTVTMVGSMATASSRDVQARIVACGGRMRRGMPSRAGFLVIGRHAHKQLSDGRLRRKLKAADERGAACLSETMLLRTIGMLGPAPAMAGVVDIDDLPEKSGLDLGTLRLLILFDLIQPQTGMCSFRDLVAAREVARLLNEGVDLADIVRGAFCASKGSSADQPLARLKLVSDGYGRLATRINGLLAELDGQMRLPLPDAGNPSVDELFEAAEEAEQLGELTVAASLYRRCIGLDRQDPIAPFNLANVLRELGDIDAATFHFRLAVGLDPYFADAWYNLALIMDRRGEKAAAQAGFERAILADPEYADPLYNLAQLHFDAGAFAEAGRLWRRYLLLDPDSEWSRRARYGLALCRQQEPTA